MGNDHLGSDMLAEMIAGMRAKAASYVEASLAAERCGEELAASTCLYVANGLARAAAFLEGTG